MLTPAQDNIIRSYISTCLLKEWVTEGHYLTGKMIEELEYRVQSDITRWMMEVWGYGYGAIQEKGVKAGRIPFGHGKRGDSSLYIKGLIDYVERRMGIMAGSKESLSVVFAIANKQKKVGMQIRTRGQGSGWFTKAMPVIDQGVAERTEMFIGERFDRIVDNMINEFNRQ